MSALALVLAPATFTNPIGPGADPSVAWDGSRYLLAWTSGNDVRYAASPTLGGLRDATPQTLFAPPPGTRWSRNLWAPEWFRDRDRWWILFAADDGRDENHRVYALRSRGRDARGPYEFAGQVPTSVSTWAIDAFLFRYRSRLYLLWSGRVTMSDPQRIYIQPMKDPLTAAGRAVAISEPTFPWERIGWPVNEGPAALVRARTITVTYAASGGTTLAYSIGRLVNAGGDPMNPRAYRKDPSPVFSSANGMWAPGHNSFFRASDGGWWSVFHAKRELQEGWGGRITAAQPVTFDGGGAAVLGRAEGWSRPWPEPAVRTAHLSERRNPTDGPFGPFPQP